MDSTRFLPVYYFAFFPLPSINPIFRWNCVTQSFAYRRIIGEHASACVRKRGDLQEPRPEKERRGITLAARKIADDIRPN